MKKNIIKKIVKEMDKKYFKNSISRFLKNIKKDKLVALYLDISGNCNLNCNACCFKEKYGEKGIMSPSTFDKLKGCFSEISDVELQCNAEPLLNPEFGEIIKSIKNENKNIRISLVTNGTLLTERNTEILLGSGIDRFSVSVDAAEKGLFEELRRGAKFDFVINNLKNAVELRNKTKSNCKIGVVTVSSKSNLSQLKSILELVKKLGVDIWTINGLEAYDAEMEKIVLYSNKINLEAEAIFNGLREEASKSGIEISMPKLEIMPYEDCVLNSCLVHWNGDVSPCSELSYEREIYSFGHKLTRPKVVFGNINTKNIFEIWNQDDYRIFRKNLKQGKIPVFCKNCLLKSKVICPIVE